MTREEAKEIFLKLGWVRVNGETIFDGDKWREACMVISEWLKEEPILDKIRSEMFKERLSHSGTGEEVIQAYADGLKKGIEIIDKYRGESYGDAE